MTDGTAVSGRTGSPAEALAAVTAPGAPFETVEEDVCGHRMEVFRDRRRSLRELLAVSMRFGERECLIEGDSRLTFRAHYGRVASLAQAFREDYGVRKGDRVAVFAANSIEWVLAFWAASSLGAVAVAMNAMWTRNEARDALAGCAPALIVADERRRARLDAVSQRVVSTEYDVPELSERYAGASLSDAPIDEDDPAVIVYTSGTTGRPKGVTHSHRNMIAAIDYFAVNYAVAERMGYPPSAEPRRILLISPLFHIMSLHNLVVPRLVFGDTAVLYGEKFDVEQVLDLIETERVTQWGMVPTMAQRLVEIDDLSRWDLSSLTAVSLGSAPSSAELQARLRTALPVAAGGLGTTYGLTESSSAATRATAADLQRYPDSVGTPVVTMQVDVIGPDGQPLPDGEEGDIRVRGPLVMLGYWNDPDATAAAIDADGWLHTGDLGVMSNGHLRMPTRRSDLIIRGGENIHPVEVEGVLQTHPGVRECAVVGVPHEDLGQEVCAVVVPQEAPASGSDDAAARGCALTFGGMAATVSSRLAKYKVPTRWIVLSPRDALPRNATRKIMRPRVVEMVN